MIKEIESIFQKLAAIKILAPKASSVNSTNNEKEN